VVPLIDRLAFARAALIARSMFSFGMLASRLGGGSCATGDSSRITTRDLGRDYLFAELGKDFPALGVNAALESSSPSPICCVRP
jgi:hypothetical protein